VATVADGDRMQASLTFIPPPDAIRPGRAGQLLRAPRPSPLDAGRLLALLRGALRRTSRFVELASEAARGQRGPRETNLCRIHVALDEPSRPSDGLRLDRQPLEGSRLAGNPENLNLMLGLPEGRGNLVNTTIGTFFRFALGERSRRGRGARIRRSSRPGSGRRGSGLRAQGRRGHRCRRARLRRPGCPPRPLASDPANAAAGRSGCASAGRSAIRDTLRAVGGQLGQRQRRHGRTGLPRRASRCGTPRAEALSVEPRRVAVRRDRHHRRPPSTVRSGGHRRARSGAGGSRGEGGDASSPRRS